jgi:hypothetical protein
MTITTEQAEQLALTAETLNRPATAQVFRSLAAERDALRAEIAELLGPPIDKAERKKNLVAAGVSEKTADEMLKSPVYDRHLKGASVDPLQAENALLRDVLREFLGFVDDATIGDVWIERKNAALGETNNAEV